MNTSISSGNYLEAQDQWERWDNRDRLRMLNAFSSHVDSQVEELEALEGVETELEHIQVEFDLIEDKYIALLMNNRQTISELESTKQELTTAITGIFLTAMVFFFLGRHINKTGDE
jgi:acyl-CoA reductase-like NAD-dependent aldehyde dehydrogenase